MTKLNSLKILLVSILASVFLVGCGIKKDSKVEDFQNGLIEEVVKKTGEKYNINAKDYSFSVANEVDTDHFEEIKSLDGLNNIYVVGHLKGNINGKEVYEITGKYNAKDETFESIQVVASNVEERVDILQWWKL